MKTSLATIRIEEERGGGEQNHSSLLHATRGPGNDSAPNTVLMEFAIAIAAPSLAMWCTQAQPHPIGAWPI